MTEAIKQKTKTIAMNQYSIRALAVFIIVAVAFYVYFAASAVHTLTVLEKSKREMQSLSMKVSEMEANYLSMQNNVSVEKATALGFKEVNNPVFLMRSGSHSSLSYNVK